MSLPFPVDWPTSLRPDYMIEEVKIRCEQSDNGSGKPLLRITCQFKSVQNKLYTVKWYVAYHHALDFLEHQIRKSDVVVFFCFVFCCCCLTFRSTIFQSFWDGATAFWVFTSTIGTLKCLAQGHYTAVVGLEPWISRSRVRSSTTKPPRPHPMFSRDCNSYWACVI